MEQGPSAALWRERIPTWALGAALMVGLAGSFIGLKVSSFWLDELYTAWVVGADHSLSAAWARALTDVHPPIYYMSLFGVTNAFGASEVPLRAYSAVCGVGAIAIFLFATDAFSLRARLFGAVLATGSSYWFYHSQDARSYALGLLFSAAMLAGAARLLKAPQDRRALAGLGLATLLSCFVHYYLFLVSEAVLAILFLLRPNLRVAAVVWGGVLLGALYAYLTFVERRYSLMLMEHGWIGSDLAWYQKQLTAAVRQTVNTFNAPAAVVCLLGFGVAVARERTRPSEMLWLAAGVPVFVLAGGIAASVVSSPNFTDRNFLLCSPFLWALAAGLYDQAFDRPSRLSPWVTTVVALSATFSAGHVLSRVLPHNTPFRESARWIAEQADCAGRPIPVVINQDTPMKPGFEQVRAQADYGHYLSGHRLPAVFKEQLMAGEQPPVSGCSVVAWGAHYVGANVDAQALARGMSTGGRVVEVRAFTVPNDRRGARSAFVFVQKQGP